MFRTFEKDDPFNWDNLRNHKNTAKNTYNCGGYALGTFSWYCPNREEDDDFFGYDFGFYNEKDAYRKTMYAVAIMAQDFMERGFRIISATNELEKDEYAVAFRLSSDGDFHYIRRMNNGIWYHKRGASPKIHKMRKTDVFCGDWCGRYDGPLVLIAIKNP